MAKKRQKVDQAEVRKWIEFGVDVALTIYIVLAHHG